MCRAFANMRTQGKSVMGASPCRAKEGVEGGTWGPNPHALTERLCADDPVILRQQRADGSRQVLQIPRLKHGRQTP